MNIIKRLSAESMNAREDMFCSAIYSTPDANHDNYNFWQAQCCLRQISPEGACRRKFCKTGSEILEARNLSHLKPHVDPPKRRVGREEAARLAAAKNENTARRRNITQVALLRKLEGDMSHETICERLNVDMMTLQSVLVGDNNLKHWAARKLVKMAGVVAA
jgi:hypothetical protein